MKKSHFGCEVQLNLDEVLLVQVLPGLGWRRRNTPPLLATLSSGPEWRWPTAPPGAALEAALVRPCGDGVSRHTGAFLEPAQEQDQTKQ